MDLLERYLQAVRFFLPRRQQDDIVRELSENLLSQMEDRAEELGRALNEDEQADILRRHGHPMLVAGRYRSHQQLIGPVFFPIYVFALKAGLGVALLVTIIVTTITTILTGAPVRQIVEAFLAFPGRALDGVCVDDAGVCGAGLRASAAEAATHVGSAQPPEGRSACGSDFPRARPRPSSSSPRPARPGCSSCRGRRFSSSAPRRRSSRPHPSGASSTCRLRYWPWRASCSASSTSRVPTGRRCGR